MSGPDDELSALLDDLSALPLRQQREVFAVLRPFERVRIQALLKERQRGSACEDKKCRSAAIFSSSISQCISSAQAGEQGGAGRMLTAATREKLLLLAEQAKEPGSSVPETVGHEVRMPLLSQLAGIFTTVRVSR